MTKRVTLGYIESECPIDVDVKVVPPDYEGVRIVITQLFKQAGRELAT